MLLVHFRTVRAFMLYTCRSSYLLLLALLLPAQDLKSAILLRLLALGRPLPLPLCLQRLTNPGHEGTFSNEVVQMASYGST